MHSDQTRVFYVFFERSPGVGAQFPVVPVPVPPGVSRLRPFRIEPLTVAPDLADAPAATVGHDWPWLEPIVDAHGKLRLLMVQPEGFNARLNGLPARRVSVLREKDFLHLTPDCSLHVSVLHRPCIGPPPAALLGRECPVCRVPFVAESRCYACQCGAGLHFEEGPDSLECVRTRTECVCGQPIILTEGFGYQPDLDYERPEPVP